ncbi:unnamed protein product, partial [Medioppia subpectinata]
LSLSCVDILQHNIKTGKDGQTNDQWIAFCRFHLAEHKAALEMYTTLESELEIALCQFYLGMYSEAKASAERAADRSSPLFNRLLFHLCHKLSLETQLVEYHQKLQDTYEDQLCLASIHFLRAHYQEAIDVYKKVLLEKREFLALNVYVALCYYKLDYYDVSQEVLSQYLQQFPESVTATNLKACNHYRLYNGKAAEQELRNLIDTIPPTFTYAQDLIRHNLVVFRGGEGALQVLPPLVDVLPEAKLNLVIFHLKNDNVTEANRLIKDLEATLPHEYVLKGVVNASVGQTQGSRDHLKTAQQCFQMVGGSASECDTIPGRQCMASCFFILKQFDDVLLYLSSIKSYFYNDDTFNFNFGQSKASTANFKEAEEVLLLVRSEKLTNDYIYVSWLTRCLIMNKKPRNAWELYLKRDNSAEAFHLLQLIANDCYKMGHFLYAMKALDALHKLDPNPEYWEGKRGAAAGVMQMVIADKEPKYALTDNLKTSVNLLNTFRESVAEVLKLLRNAPNGQSSQMINTIKNWAKESKVMI